MRSTRPFLAGLALVGGAIAFAALPASASSHPRATARASSTITIGSTNFGEQVILANIYADVLTGAGYKVTLKTDLGTRAAVEPALAHGQLDLYPDYDGSLVAFLDSKVGSKANTPTTAVPILKSLLAKSGATVLTPAAAVDTNVFAITKATQSKYKLPKSPTLSEIKSLASKFVLGAPPECATNAYCGLGLKKVYGLTFKSLKSTDEAGPITVAALKSNTVQVAEFFSSDGNIYHYGFVQLADNLNLEPADHIIPVIRNSVDTAKVASLLNAIAPKLTTTALAAMNAAVTFENANAAVVARGFVTAEHLK